MIAETFTAEHTWRLLWSHAAYQVISTFFDRTACEAVTVGYGWGLRDRANHRRALLLHPSGRERAIGDLALTIPGHETHVIPRYLQSYTEYLDQVHDVVETVLHAHLAE